MSVIMKQLLMLIDKLFVLYLISLITKKMSLFGMVFDTTIETILLTSIYGTVEFEMKVITGY